MSNEIQNEELHMMIGLLIFSPNSQILINIKTGALKNSDHIDDVYFQSVIGSKDLSRNWSPKQYYTKIVNPLKRPHESGRTELVPSEMVGGFNAIARNMSIIYPISKEEVESLILPYMKQGITRVWVFTLANSRGLANSFTMEKYGFQNMWCINGTKPVCDWSYINQLLKKRGSAWRIRNDRIFLEKVAGLDV